MLCDHSWPFRGSHWHLSCTFGQGVSVGRGSWVPSRGSLVLSRGFQVVGKFVVCEMRICSLRNEHFLSCCVYSDILDKKFPPQKNVSPCAECVTFSLPRIKFKVFRAEVFVL